MHEQEVENLKDKLERTCFVCGAENGKDTHLTVGGHMVKKMHTETLGKTNIVVVRHAPIGCYLANEKKWIQEFYRKGRWKEWKK